MKKEVGIGLVAIVVCIMIALFLFVVNPLAPSGVITPATPAVTNFTGTTTVNESYGYVCQAWHVGNNVIQEVCSQQYSGLLNIPLTPEIATTIWLLGFFLSFLGLFLYHRIFLRAKAIAKQETLFAQV